MTVVECARRILDKDWSGVESIDIQTLGYALIMVEATKKKS